ncbi:MAG: zf-HC2 domain-containing protein [Planctomycetes bacterium]|nr:zf-HC2 domain-containing protein [Planctomycetota bacterium]
MNCDSVRSRLVPFAAGLLEEGEAAAFREHLAFCPACAARLAAVLPYSPGEATSARLELALTRALDSRQRSASPAAVRRRAILGAAIAAVLLALASVPEPEARPAPRPVRESEGRPSLAESRRHDPRPELADRFDGRTRGVQLD